METKKITEGGMLTALMVTVGMTMTFSGIGYWLYLDLMAPVMIALLHLRCGQRTGIIAACSTGCLTFLIFGDMVLFLYLMQALLMGLICSTLIQSKQDLMEDLVMESLACCVLTLILDKITALLTGVSLLDDLPSIRMADFSPYALEVFYYLAIASVPLVSGMAIYIGTLVAGKYLHLLGEGQVLKYNQVRFYRALAPWIYCSDKMVRVGTVGLVSVGIVAWQLERGYLKALLLCTMIILLYFILQDAMKVIVIYSHERGGKCRWLAPLVQGSLLVALLVAFKVTALGMMGMALVVNKKYKIKTKKKVELQWMGRQVARWR